MEVNGQLHAPAALPTGKSPSRAQWIGGWVDPEAGLDDVEHRITCPCLLCAKKQNQNVGPSDSDLNRLTRYNLKQNT
jgi:hypothetical protein